MKRFILFFLFISTICAAQEVKTQKDILQLPNTDLVKDFNLKVQGNIKPTVVSKATYRDMGFAFVGHKLTYGKDDYSLETLTFKNNLLTRKETEFRYGGNFLKPKRFGFSYIYNTKGQLAERKSDKDEFGGYQNTYYKFDSKNIIEEVKDIGLLGDGSKLNNLHIYTKKNNSLSYKFNNGNTTYHLKNALISKQITFNKSANKTYTNSYLYDDNGYLKFEDRGSSKNSYHLNKNNLIEKEIRKNYTKHYKYIYDKYGNWIIAYPLSVTSKGLYGSQFSFLVREIKYSNGDITGGKTPEHKNIKENLLRVRSELYDELINGKKTYAAKNIRYFDLGLPQTDLVEDFNLKIGNGNIVPKQINKVYYDQRTSRRSAKLTTKVMTKSYMTFDTKTKKVKAFNVVRNKKTTYYTYTYDLSGRLVSYLSDEPSYKVKENYKYNSKGDFSKETLYNGKAQPSKQEYKKTSYGFISSGITNQKFYFKNNLLEKTVINYNSKEPSENFNTYNNKGKRIKYEGSFYANTYAYNANGDMIMLKETSKRNSDVTTRTYAYKYDKYGNWIIQLNLLDMSIARGLPSFPNPTLREIKYSNGEITGTTDITKVENDLVELRRKVKNVNTNSTNQVATWKKMKEGSFYFYLNNKPVQMAKLFYMGNDILAFIQDNNQLYILENIKTAKSNTTYKAKRTTIETSHGYWFKKPNGSVSVFKNNGVHIQKNSLYKYAPNNIDVFYQGEGEPNKVVLKNYKNAQSYTVYPAIAFSQYNSNNLTTNTTAKRSGKCLKGDCDNGYGEFKHSNGYMSEGFFRNSTPYGPMHVSKESINESSIAFLKGNYKNYKGVQYRYSNNRYTEMIDYNKQMGIMNDSKERKSYVYNFKNGKVASKTLLKEKSNTGCIVGNCYNGAGVYKYNSGSFYFGFFKNGKRHGFGRLTFKDGKEYIGEFDMNTYSGMGTYIISKYNYYMGEFRNNTYNGQGVMYYSKTRYDAGNWKDGYFQGKSTTTSTTYQNTNTNTTKTAKTTSFNSLSNYDKGSIELCKKNASCVAAFFEKLYEKTQKSSSSVITTKKMTDYFHSLYNINPDMAYRICFKLNGDTFKSIDRKSLPQSVQDYLKNRAQNLMNNYKKDMKKKGY